MSHYAYVAPYGLKVAVLVPGTVPKETGPRAGVPPTFREGAEASREARVAAQRPAPTGGRLLVGDGERAGVARRHSVTPRSSFRVSSSPMVR